MNQITEIKVQLNRVLGHQCNDDPYSLNDLLITVRMVNDHQHLLQVLLSGQVLLQGGDARRLRKTLLICQEYRLFFYCVLGLLA